MSGNVAFARGSRDGAARFRLFAGLLDQSTVSENSRRQHLLTLRKAKKKEKEKSHRRILMRKKIRKLRRAGRR